MSISTKKKRNEITAPHAVRDFEKDGKMNLMCDHLWEKFVCMLKRNENMSFHTKKKKKKLPPYCA